MARGNDEVTYAGYVFKEGHLFKTWKKRFLVVKRNDLAYYKDTEMQNRAQLLGAMKVERIERLNDITNGLLIISDEGRELKIFLDTRAESDKCYNAIVPYCRQRRSHQTASSSSVSSFASASTAPGSSGPVKRVGWLDKEGKHFRTWKKRYFVLEGTTLWYSAQINSEVLGRGRVIATRREPTKQFTLVATMEGGRELRLVGKSEFDIDEWHKAMRRGMQEAHEARNSVPTFSPPPAPMESGDSAYSLFGGSVEDYGGLPDPAGEGEQRKSDMEPATSFRRHITILDTRDDAPANASFIECAPEPTDPIEKPWSPTAPGTATIRRMRIAEMLLQEELEEERKEALLKEQDIFIPALRDEDDKDASTGGCCCIIS